MDDDGWRRWCRRSPNYLCTYYTQSMYNFLLSNIFFFERCRSNKLKFFNQLQMQIISSVIIGNQLQPAGPVSPKYRIRCWCLVSQEKKKKKKILLSAFNNCFFFHFHFFYFMMSSVIHEYHGFFYISSAFRIRSSFSLSSPFPIISMINVILNLLATSMPMIDLIAAPPLYHTSLPAIHIGNQLT
jgi:hypothetical protein